MLVTRDNLLKITATCSHTSKGFPVKSENSTEWKSAFMPVFKLLYNALSYSKAFSSPHTLSQKIFASFEWFLRSRHESNFLVFEFYQGERFNLEFEIPLAQISYVVADL